MAVEKKSGYRWLGGGLWVIPLLMFLGGAIFARQAYIAHNSNSTTQLPDGTIVDNTGNVPYTEIGQFWFAVVLFVVGIGVLIWMRRDK